MNVYATLKLEDVSEVLELYESQMGAMLQIGFDLYPILSVDASTNEIEVGEPAQITYH